MNRTNCRSSLSGWLFLATCGLCTAEARALTYTVPLSTQGVVFVPGGQTIIPSAQVSARRPITLLSRPAQADLVGIGDSLQFEMTMIFMDSHLEDVTVHPAIKYCGTRDGVGAQREMARAAAKIERDAAKIREWQSQRCKDCP